MPGDMGFESIKTHCYCREPGEDLTAVVAEAYAAVKLITKLLQDV